jgi:hypothetical protein
LRQRAEAGTNRLASRHHTGKTATAPYCGARQPPEIVTAHRVMSEAGMLPDVSA